MLKKENGYDMPAMDGVNKEHKKRIRKMIKDYNPGKASAEAPVSMRIQLKDHTSINQTCCHRR